MKQVFVVDARRTAIGNFEGALSSLSAAEFTVPVIRSLLENHGLAADCVDEVILGQVLQAGAGQNPARQAAIAAGLPESTPAFGVNKVCGSGMKAVTLAAQALQLGDADCIIAGGMESMSRAPHLLPQSREGCRLGHGQMTDSVIADGLWDAFDDVHMGVTAENIVAEHGITREEQDAFAVSSQQKAGQALAAGRFRDEIVPVSIPQRKKDPIIFDADEYPRPETSLKKLASLRPAFKKDGTVTAGNASGINDGAACLMLAGKEFIGRNSLTPMARIVSYATHGLSPALMGMGPVGAVQKALDKAGWTISDLDLIEANEAFAVQALAVGRQLGWNAELVNVNGGAIALGHPIGASGARIITTLLHEMKKRKASKGLATLCIGGGMGIAVCLEAVV